MKYQEVILKAIQGMGTQFQADELAYLALTSKIEQPIRDRLAYILYKQLDPTEVMVSREWKRIDLAILHQGQPRVLVELKAMYTFDAAMFPKNVHGYMEAMQKDLVKASKVSKADTELYTILLATHPRQGLPACFQGVIKYRNWVNRALAEFNGEAEVLLEAKKVISKALERVEGHSSGSIEAGKAFGISTQVAYWLLGPFKPTGPFIEYL